MGEIRNFTPGETITAPALIYFDAVDGKGYKASATTRENPATAIVLVDCVADVANQAWLFGTVPYAYGEVASGTALYLGETPGEIVSAPPGNAQLVGRQIDSTQSYFTFEGFTPEIVNFKKIAFLGA